MTLVILAAGIGSRYGGLKQLDVVGDKDETIIDFSLFDAIEAGFNKVVFIVRAPILEQVKEVFSSKLNDRITVEFVCQEIDEIPNKFKANARVKPWGTGHALLMAKEVVSDNFCVINADDFYGKDAFLKMGTFLKSIKTDKNNFSMVGYKVKNTLSKTGTVSRGECTVDSTNYLEKIIERTDIFEDKNSICYTENDIKIELKKNTIASMNFWGFTPTIFNEIEEQFHQFLEHNYTDLKKEFYLPSVVNNIINNNKATVKVLETNSNWMGVTYKEDKQTVIDTIKKLKENNIYPNLLWS